MRLKTVVVALFFSLVFMVSRVSYADTLTYQSSESDPAQDGDYPWGPDYVYPYYFTYTGQGGTNTLVAMSCMNFERDIAWGESWDVTPLLVSSVSTNELIDNGAFTGTQVLEDAYLFNEYAAATGDDLLSSEIQYAIWSIMDPAISSDPSFNATGEYDSVSQGLATDAINNASSEPSSYFGNDVAFVPVNGTQSSGGEPQIFMTNPIPPAVAPEPTSLVLLGTGLFGAVAFMRRKHGKA